MKDYFDFGEIFNSQYEKNLINNYLLAFQMMYLSYDGKDVINEYLRKNKKEDYIYNSNSILDNYFLHLPKVLYNQPTLDEEDLLFKELMGLELLSESNKKLLPHNVLPGIINKIKRNVPNYSVKYLF